MLWKSCFALILFSAGVLSGCQHRQHPPVTAEAQISQLSSLVAGAAWLRDRCERKDIAADNVLMNAALQQAEARGWANGRDVYSQLAVAVSARYQALTDDSVAQTVKCATLNQALARFLQRMPSSQ